MGVICMVRLVYAPILTYIHPHTPTHLQPQLCGHFELVLERIHDMLQKRIGTTLAEVRIGMRVDMGMGVGWRLAVETSHFGTYLIRTFATIVFLQSKTEMYTLIKKRVADAQYANFWYEEAV